MPNFEDWAAIVETKSRYCRCLDTKDWAGYGDCFTEDFLLLTPPDGKHSGRDAAVAYVRSHVGPWKTVHHVHNPEIAFDGPDAADVIWAMQDRNDWGEEYARKIGYSGHMGFGHYHERYVRCPDGKWRIKTSKLSYLNMDHFGVVERA